MASRLGLKRKAIAVKNDTNVFEVVKEYDDLFGVDVVIVDECQFLKKRHIEELTDIADDLDIPVMCYGQK